MPENTDARDANLRAQERMGEIVSSGAFDHLDEVLSERFVDHDPADGQPAGPAGIGWFWQQFGAAFSELSLEPVVVDASDEYVTAVLRVSGTHTGEFLGHPATGRRFTVRGIQVGRFADGRMTERWGSTDQLGMLQQLGLA